MAVSSSITRTTLGSPISFFFTLLNKPGKCIQASADRYLNTATITRMENATIMRDSQTFEQCPHLGSELAQTAIKQSPNDITVIEYWPLSDLLPTSVFHDPRLNCALLQFHKLKGRKSMRSAAFYLP